MKSKIYTFIFLVFMSLAVFAQETDKKAAKEKKRTEKENQVKALLDSGEFVFIADRAMPQGSRTVDLISYQAYVKFQPDFIESSLPYFGRAYSGVGYGNDSGLNFEGKPENYTLEQGKKNAKIIKARVNGENDSFNLQLTVTPSGYATLIVLSNNRNSISYSGVIKAPEKSLDKDTVKPKDH